MINPEEYKDLVVGEVYYGIWGSSKFYFKYLGNGEWTGGTPTLRAKYVYPNVPHNSNTYRVTVIAKVDYDDLEGTNNKILNNIVKKEPVKYKILNVPRSSSNQTLFKVR